MHAHVTLFQQDLPTGRKSHKEQLDTTGKHQVTFLHLKGIARGKARMPIKAAGARVPSVR